MHRRSRFVSFLGGPRLRTVLVVVLSLSLMLRRRVRSAAFLIVATGGMGALNTVIKKLVRRRRPRALAGLRQAGGFSFPSGHSSGSFVFFGTLAYLIWRTTLHRILALMCLGGAAILTTLVGRSRVHLRAHHRSDVLAGQALGAVWLALVIRLFARRLGDEERPAT